MSKMKKEKPILGRIPLKGFAFNPLATLPRNEPCFCGSGKKFKKCCLDKTIGSTTTTQEASRIKELLKQSKKGDKVTQPTFKVPRALPEIQAEYNNACIKAGDLQYKILCFKEELDKVNEMLKEINQEAQARMTSDAQEAQAKAAQEAAEKAKVPVPPVLVETPATPTEEAANV